MLQELVKVAEGDKDSLAKQNNKLLLSKNPHAKTQYLDQIRTELNQTKKAIIKLEKENKDIRVKDESSSKKVHLFVEKMCALLKISQKSLETDQPSTSFKRNPDDQLHDLLTRVLKQAEQRVASLFKSDHQQQPDYLTNMLNQSTSAISNNAAHHNKADISSSFIKDDDAGVIDDDDAVFASFEGSKMLLSKQKTLL